MINFTENMLRNRFSISFPIEHTKNMNIVQVNEYDIGGGAEKVAMDLHRSYLIRGLQSTLFVARKKSDYPEIFEFPIEGWPSFWSNLDKKILEIDLPGKFRFHNLIKDLPNFFFQHNAKKGKEFYSYPGTRTTLIRLLPNTDIYQFHNLHQSYFDLTCLASISNKKPVIITMHDEYLFTGHCAITFGCERWRIGCGDCPRLDAYPAIEMDNSHYNWQRKKRIFFSSNVNVVVPSQWLARKVADSLLSHLPVHVIPNGVDLEVFLPGGKFNARDALEIPKEVFLVLFVANSGRESPFKDFTMLDRVFEKIQLSRSAQPIMFLSLGGKSLHKKSFNGNTFWELPFEKDPKMIAKFYQACDVYIHPAKAENFPLVTLEAMACGKAVIATNVGGTAEQVRDGINGYVVPAGDDQMMTQRLLQLIDSPDLLKSLSENALKVASEEFGLNRMVDSYLSLYIELFEERKKNAKWIS